MRHHNHGIRAHDLPRHLDALVQLAADLDFIFRISGQPIRHDKRRTNLLDAETVAVSMHDMFYGILTFPFIKRRGLRQKRLGTGGFRMVNDCFDQFRSNMCRVIFFPHMKFYGYKIPFCNDFSQIPCSVQFLQCVQLFLDRSAVLQFRKIYFFTHFSQPPTFTTLKYRSAVHRAPQQLGITHNQSRNPVTSFSL